MSKRTPPKTTSGGDNPYDVHDAKLSKSATAHESSSVTAHEISNTSYKNTEPKPHDVSSDKLYFSIEWRETKGIYGKRPPRGGLQ